MRRFWYLATPNSSKEALPVPGPIIVDRSVPLSSVFSGPPTRDGSAFACRQPQENQQLTKTQLDGGRDPPDYPQIPFSDMDYEALELAWEGGGHLFAAEGAPLGSDVDDAVADDEAALGADLVAGAVVLDQRRVRVRRAANLHLASEFNKNKRFTSLRFVAWIQFLISFSIKTFTLESKLLFCRNNQFKPLRATKMKAHQRLCSDKL